MNMDKLELYYFERCPFCQLVLAKIKETNIDVKLNDIKKDKIHEEQLLKDTGKKTVPVLYINGKPLSESSEIVKWLQENKDKLNKIN